MRTLRQRWTRFWFEPVGPANLGICRVLFFGAIFLFYFREDFSAWAEVSDVFWRPIWLFDVLNLPVLSSDLLATVTVVWKASLALSCLGLLTRVSTASSFVFGTYLLGLPHNFGYTSHAVGLVVIVLGIMALSRCGDGVSLDRVIHRARRDSNPSDSDPRISGEYTWPIRAVWLTFSLVFFAAGVTKLRSSGLEWIFSDHLAIIMVRSNYGYVLDPLVAWGLILAQYGWLTRSMAAATILLEVGYPLALFSSRARWIVVPAMFLMLVNIRLLLGPPFYEFLICHLFWVPWNRVSRRLAGISYSLLSLHKPSNSHENERCEQRATRR